MILFKKSADISKWLDHQRKKGSAIGFVPTMGAIHLGHISLLKAARKNNQVTVCSIFVNPAQFNDKADFEKYPITIENDIYQLESNGCDVLFLPPLNEIYPNGYTELPDYKLGYLDTILEGKFRPGHYQGVCKVVHQLINIIQPAQLFLGQKDYQQCLVLKKLLTIQKKDSAINISICPTLRESDGLAMSSRNLLLNNEERTKASQIYKCLALIKEKINPANIPELLKESRKGLLKAGFQLEYLEIADAESLQIVNEWDDKKKLVVLVAVFLNKIRLIDNILIT
jgi:pantoate--beta-alanine ligase